MQVASARFSYYGRGFARSARFTSYGNQECMIEVVKPKCAWSSLASATAGLALLAPLASHCMPTQCLSIIEVIKLWVKCMAWNIKTKMGDNDQTDSSKCL